MGMRFLHTSDWHLGRGLGGHDLSAAQVAAVDHIIDVALEEHVEAFIIAGDVFDRAFPSVEDVRALNRALTRIHAAGIPVIMTAGNHDEGARLASYRGMLADGITVVGEYEQVGTAVELHDAHGPVVFYPLPYLDPDGARRVLAATPDEPLPRSHEAVMAEAMRRVRSDLQARRAEQPATRAVVIAHAFVVNGKETAQQLEDEQSKSERDITVGGVATVPSAVFDGVHYVALGHLHGPRDVVAGPTRIRYSGSLLRYSLSELRHEKSVTVVDLSAEGACTVTTHAIPQPAGMARLRGSLAEVCSDTNARHHDDFVEITLTDVRLPDNFYAQLDSRFRRILHVEQERPKPVTGADDAGAVAVAQLKPIDTLRNYYEHATGAQVTPRLDAVLQDVLERALKDVGA